jgi:hypothetical protein
MKLAREGNMEPGDDRPTGKEKVWAVVRMVLGLGQMMAAVVTFYVLIQTGMNALSLGAVAVTCVLTSLSLLVFGSRK